MRPWTEIERAKLRREWFGRSLFELSELFDRAERSIACEGYRLGLHKNDYAAALARNDAQTVQYCALLLRDNDWGYRQIAEKLEMCVEDVHAIHNQIKQELRHARLC